MPIHVLGRIIELLDGINLKTSQIREGFTARYGLTSAQARVVRFLRRCGPQNVRALAKQLATGASNITPICQRLERNGLVERTRDAHDQRAVSVRLTPPGERIADELERDIAQSLAEELPEMPGDAQRTVLEGLRILSEYLSHPPKGVG